MRFSIVNSQPSQHQKYQQNDTQTRHNSGNKMNKGNMFLQMVKMSYDYYKSLNHQQFKLQHLKTVQQKNHTIKNIQKKEQMRQKRQRTRYKKKKKEKKLQKQKKIQIQGQIKQIKEDNQIIEKNQLVMNSKIFQQDIISSQKQMIKATGQQEIQQFILTRQIRRSDRNKDSFFRINYCQTQDIQKSSNNERKMNKRSIFKQDQLFDVLDLDQNKVHKNKNNIIPLNLINHKITFDKQNSKNKQQKTNMSLNNADSFNQSLVVLTSQQKFILQPQNTYQIGIQHQFILRALKVIDQFINFKHQIREQKTINLNQLLKYLKTNGFSKFNQKKFKILVKINPHLFNLKISYIEFPIIILTRKLNQQQIEQRNQQTRKKMTQVFIQWFDT